MLLLILQLWARFYMPQSLVGRDLSPLPSSVLTYIHTPETGGGHVSSPACAITVLEVLTATKASLLVISKPCAPFYMAQSLIARRVISDLSPRPHQLLHTYTLAPDPTSYYIHTSIKISLSWRYLLSLQPTLLVNLKTICSILDATVLHWSMVDL